MADLSGRCPGCRRPSCDGCGLYRERKKEENGADEKRKLQALHTNKQVNLRFPKGFAAEKGEGLGLCVDAGTTTLAMMLWDLKDGRLLAAETASNPQAVFGADVVSRVQAAEDEKKRKEMQGLLVRELDEYHDIKGQCLVIIGTTPKYYHEISEQLKGQGFTHWMGIADI